MTKSTYDMMGRAKTVKVYITANATDEPTSGEVRSVTTEYNGAGQATHVTVTTSAGAVTTTIDYNELGLQTSVEETRDGQSSKQEFTYYDMAWSSVRNGTGERTGVRSRIAFPLNMTARVA